MKLNSRLLLTSAILASSLFCPSGWAKDKRDDISKIGKRNVAHKSIISLEKERAIGKQCTAEIESWAKLITDPQVGQYIDGVAQTIVLNSDLKIPLVVKVIDSPEPNGLILPGGVIYLNSGFIRIMDGEGELAGGLAYGAADIATRHWAAEQTKATILQYAMVPLIFTPTTYGTYYGTMEAHMNGTPLAYLKFSREDVAESDYFAVQYLYKAGYDPNSYIELLNKFAKMEDAQANKTPQIFRDRPPARVRISNCQKEISQFLPPRTPSLPANAEFDMIKALLPNTPKTMP